MKSKMLSNSMMPNAINKKIMMNAMTDPTMLKITLTSAPTPAERDALGFSSSQMRYKTSPTRGKTNPKTAYPKVEFSSSTLVFCLEKLRLFPQF